MSDYKVTDTQLASIANAIRAKTGKSAQIEFPTEFVSEIGSISGGGNSNILSGIADPGNAIGSNGDIYIKYIGGNDVFGSPQEQNYNNKRIISANAFYIDYSPNKAFGNQSSGWVANAYNGTLIYEFLNSDTHLFSPLKLSFIDYFDVSGGSAKANTFSFEGSNDGNSWDVLYQKTDEAEEKNVIKTVDILTENMYSKFRFSINGGSSYAGIKNVVMTADVQGKPIDSSFIKFNGSWILLDNGNLYGAN